MNSATHAERRLPKVKKRHIFLGLLVVWLALGYTGFCIDHFSYHSDEYYYRIAVDRFLTRVPEDVIKKNGYLTVDDFMKKNQNCCTADWNSRLIDQFTRYVGPAFGRSKVYVSVSHGYVTDLSEGWRSIGVFVMDSCGGIWESFHGNGEYFSKDDAGGSQ